MVEVLECLKQETRGFGSKVKVGETTLGSGDPEKGWRKSWTTMYSWNIICKIEVMLKVKSVDLSSTRSGSTSYPFDSGPDLQYMNTGDHSGWTVRGKRKERFCSRDQKRDPCNF